MKISERQKQVFNISTFTLSAISLLADILGLGKVAYDVVVQGNLNDLLFKVLILVLVFMFGGCSVGNNKYSVVIRNYSINQQPSRAGRKS